MTAPNSTVARPAPNPRIIKVRITYNGLEERLELAETETIAALLALAIAAFPVTEPNHLLALFDLKGTELAPETQTLAEAGIKNNARLILRQSVVKGG